MLRALGLALAAGVWVYEVYDQFRWDIRSLRDIKRELAKKDLTGDLW